MSDAMTAAKMKRQMFWQAANALRCLEAGKLDRLFADAETKAWMRADLEQELVRLVQMMLRADPQYEQLPDGAWKLNDSNVVPLRATKTKTRSPAASETAMPDPLARTATRGPCADPPPRLSGPEQWVCVGIYALAAAFRQTPRGDRQRLLNAVYNKIIAGVFSDGQANQSEAPQP